MTDTIRDKLLTRLENAATELADSQLGDAPEIRAALWDEFSKAVAALKEYDLLAADDDTTYEVITRGVT